MGSIIKEKAEIQRKASASTEIQHRCIPVVNDVQVILENLESSLSFMDCCIYKVPDRLRKLKEEDYTPKVISIGPFHHYNGKLKNMEKLKFRYLKCFLKRVEGRQISVEDLVNTIMSHEESVRRCYAETIQYDSDDFVKIILVDAIFILELFCRFNGLACEDTGPSLELWLEVGKREDLSLLENQLPFFILEVLFDKAFAPLPNYSQSFRAMTIDYFDFVSHRGMQSSVFQINHFLDLLRTLWLPFEMFPARPVSVPSVNHVPSATQLHMSGLVFKVGSSSSIGVIEYTDGELRMPAIYFDKFTVRLYRNLLALEQCHYPDKAYVTDYFILLGFLINTTEDVNLLVQKGILVNKLRNSDDARDLVNSLVVNVVCADSISCDYEKIYNELNALYDKSWKIPWDSWMETLRREYFNTPWRTASTFAAIILLVLTLLQTVYTVLPKK